MPQASLCNKTRKNRLFFYFVTNVSAYGASPIICIVTDVRSYSAGNFVEHISSRFVLDHACLKPPYAVK